MLEGAKTHTEEVMQWHFLYLCTNLETFSATTSVARRQSHQKRSCCKRLLILSRVTYICNMYSVENQKLIVISMVWNSRRVNAKRIAKHWWISIKEVAESSRMHYFVIHWHAMSEGNTMKCWILHFILFERLKCRFQWLCTVRKMATIYIFTYSDWILSTIPIRLLAPYLTA